MAPDAVRPRLTSSDVVKPVERATVAEQRLERIRRVAHWLDAGIRVPGTRIRIGLDPIVGLVPGLGDAIAALVGGTVFVEGVRRGASRATMIRIAANIAFDFLVGSVPLLGDVFDFAWKANLRNVELLERSATEPHVARRSDRMFVAFLAVTLVLACLAIVALAVAVPAWLLSR